MSKPSDWFEFWTTREITPYRDTVWRMSMEYFLEATDPVLGYDPDDVVLDVGCGAGYLAEFLHERVAAIHGVDISRKYLDHCEAKLGHIEHCHFHELDQRDPTDLGFLPEGRFTKIVCLSVVQYYESLDDLESLVKSLSRIAAPGARCLIADIPLEDATGVDAMSLLGLAARRGHLIDTLRYLLKMRFSRYHRVRSINGVLRYDPDVLSRMAERLQLDAQLLPDDLTINRSRSHWLIRF